MYFRNFIPALMLAAGSCAHAAPPYSLTALRGDLTANGINNAGQVVGNIATNQGQRGFIWTGGVFEILGTLGGSFSNGQAINDAGHVAGTSGLPDDTFHAFRRTGGALVDLGTLGGPDSFGLAINNAGQVAGQTLNAAGQFRAFSWSRGTMSDLGTLGGDFGFAQGINSAGHVVGQSSLASELAVPDTHAFLHADGIMRDLGTLGGRFSLATAVNDLDQVVGSSTTASQAEHAFLFTDGAMRDLGGFGGRHSLARAINESGAVVGFGQLEDDFTPRAFLYADGVMRDLNTLVDPAPGWTLIDAAGINDAQQILALGCRGEVCETLLLNQVAPVPEPGSCALLLAGLGVLGWRRLNAAYRRA